MELLDWIMVAVYFAALLGVAWWVIRKGKDTTDDYFLAGRNLGWFIIGASIFSSNIGSEHLVGLAGSGCTDGVAMAHYELHAWCILVLGWVMVPFYARSMVYTMPEFLEKRFNATARWVLSVISLVAYVLTKIAVGIFAGGIVFGWLLPELQLDLGFVVLNSFWIGSVLVIVLTGIYTVLGGLRAVAYTEAMQTLILVFGSVLVTVFGLIALGGWGELRKAPYKGSDLAEDYNEGFNLWKPLVPKGAEGTWEAVLEKDGQGKVVRQAWYFKGEGSSYPWLGMLFCAPIIGLWYWCTDQYIVQRALGAPNERVARRGSIFAGFLKLLPVFIFIIPGMICFALAKSYWSEPTLVVVAKWPDAAPQEVESRLARPLEQAVKGMTGLREVRSAVYQGRSETTLSFQATPPWSPGSLVEQVRQRALAGVPEEIGSKVAISVGTPRAARLAELLDEKGDPVPERCQGAFPAMVLMLPTVVRGIVVAGLLSALMSSLAGVFNASSTLFTMDLYQKFKPEASQHQLVWTGRVATTVMVLIGLAWIPVIQGARGLYEYLQSVQGYLAPPIFVVFFFGVFMKRLNAKGCLAALVVGFILGAFRLAVDTPVALKISGFGGYTEGSFLWIVNNIYFQYYSLFVFVVSVIVMILVSYMTEPPSPERISGLTYATVTEEHRLVSRESWNWKDVTATLIVLLAIVAAYLYFTG